jgi:hypothetical protein
MNKKVWQREHLLRAAHKCGVRSYSMLVAPFHHHHHHHITRSIHMMLVPPCGVYIALR